MSAIDKKAFINDLYQRTETLLDFAIKSYQNLDESKLMFTADQYSWRVADCLAHLNSYGHYYFPKIDEILSKPNHFSSSPYVAGWLGAYVVRMMDSTKRFKAAKQHLPDVKNAYEEVAEFISQQERLLKYIKAFEKIDLNQIRISISVSKLIKLKIGDVLAFMVSHNERHAAQITRVLRQQSIELGQRTVFTSLAL